MPFLQSLLLDMSSEIRCRFFKVLTLHTSWLYIRVLYPNVSPLGEQMLSKPSPEPNPYQGKILTCSLVISKLVNHEKLPMYVGDTSRYYVQVLPILFLYNNMNTGYIHSVSCLSIWC